MRSKSDILWRRIPAFRGGLWRVGAEFRMFFDHRVYEVTRSSIFSISVLLHTLLKDSLLNILGELIKARKIVTSHLLFIIVCSWLIINGFVVGMKVLKSEFIILLKCFILWKNLILLKRFILLNVLILLKLLNIILYPVLEPIATLKAMKLKTNPGSCIDVFSSSTLIPILKRL